MATSADFTLTIPAVTAGEQVSVILSRPSRQYSATFTAAVAGLEEEVVMTVLSENDTKVVYGWDVPLSWCSEVTDSVSAAGTLSADIAFDSAIDALDNPHVCTVSEDFTFYVPESVRPTASLECEISNDNAVARSWGLAIRGMSRVDFSVIAIGALGAQVKSCTFSLGAQQMTGYVGQTPLLSAAGTFVPTIRLVDSRGRSAAVEASPITVWDYHPPKLSGISVMRCQSDGTVDSGGDYLKVRASAACASVDGRNGVSLTVRIRPVGGTWGSAVTLESGVFSILPADSEAVYEAEFTAKDTLGTVKTVTAVSGTAAVAFHLREGGGGAAFGKRADSDGLHCAWDASFDGKVKVTGEVSAGTLKVGGKSLLDLVYPVGAVYMSLSSTSPATLFGGTWTAISGRFLLAANATYAAASTGGAASHTLTTAQLPAHSHRVKGNTDATSVGHDHGIPNIKSGQSGEYGVYAETWGYGSGSRDLNTNFVDITHNHAVDITSQTTGGGKSFSLLPPYMAVYMWRRTA